MWRGKEGVERYGNRGGRGGGESNRNALDTCMELSVNKFNNKNKKQKALCEVITYGQVTPPSLGRLKVSLFIQCCSLLNSCLME